MPPNSALYMFGALSRIFDLYLPPSFMDKETEAQRSELPSPGMHSQLDFSGTLEAPRSLPLSWQSTHITPALRQVLPLDSW